MIDGGTAIRKSKSEAALTRKRIVTTAAGEFRKHGVVATGLIELMRAVGLTHGGFYKHFESKDQLVVEALTEAMEILRRHLADSAAAGTPIVKTYLSARHRDNPAAGCPLAAIGSELARSDEKTRQVATAGFRQLVELVAGQSKKTRPIEARREAVAAVSTMIGALTLSRIVTDPRLSLEILKSAEKSLSDTRADQPNPPANS